jgi:hypothetical protein
VVLDDGTCQIWNWEKGVLVVKAGLARGRRREGIQAGCMSGGLIGSG